MDRTYRIEGSRVVGTESNVVSLENGQEIHANDRSEINFGWCLYVDCLIVTTHGKDSWGFPSDFDELIALGDAETNRFYSFTTRSWEPKEDILKEVFLGGLKTITVLHFLY